MKSIKIKNLRPNLKANNAKKIPSYLLAFFSDINSLLTDSYLVNAILIGSASRNELSIKTTQTKTIFYSDIEFILLYPLFLSKNIKKNLSRVVDKYKKQIKNKSIFFDIDYGYYSYLKFLLSPNSVWKYELLENGIPFTKHRLFILKRIFHINIKNLSFNSVNDLIYIRLWHSLNFLKSKYIEADKHFMLARNLLDVLTIFLPNKGVLLGSYSQRNEYIKKNRFKFTNKYGKIFTDALAIKLDPKLSSGASIELEKYIEIYEDLHREIKNKKKFQLTDIRYMIRFSLLMLNLRHYVYLRNPITFRNNMAKLLISMHLYFTSKKNNQIKSYRLLANIISENNNIFKRQILKKNIHLKEAFDEAFSNLKIIFSFILKNPSKVKP